MSEASILETVNQFNEAFGRKDVDAIMAAMTEDCVFESTSPPDGERFEGQEAVRAFWQKFFAESPNADFETEDMFTSGDRVVVRWIYTWKEHDELEGHVRGIDVFRVQDGKVAEKASYVKG